MKLNFLMNIKLFDYKKEEKDLRIIWRIVPENLLEADILDFTDRFLDININDIKSSLITTINSEHIYNTNQLRKIISDKHNLTEIFLSYLEEKGGISSIEPVIRTLEKLADTLKIPSKFSGVTLSQKKLSEFIR